MEINQQDDEFSKNVDTATSAETANEYVEDSSPEESVDYQRLYEEEQAKLRKAEHTLASMRYKNSSEQKQAKKPASGKIDPDEIVEQVTSRLTEQMKTLVDTQRMQETEDIFEEELGTLTSDPDERRLVKLMYDQRVQKKGFSRSAIREDLQLARFIANKPKYEKEKRELVNTVATRRTLGSTGVGTNMDKANERPMDFTKIFSQADLTFMQNSGMTDAQIKALAEQRLSKS